MAVVMLADLRGDDQTRRDQRGERVVSAPRARQALWDGIVAALDS